MKLKKNIFRLALVAVFIATIVSCQKEDDPPSGGGGGLDRDKFLGAWHVASTGTESNNQFWDMTIVAGSSNSEIYLDNFDQMGATNHVTATVSGSSFTVPQQTVNGIIYKGNGTYSSSTLTFNYTADDQANPIDTVSASANR
jgi:hypothetical protein